MKISYYPILLAMLLVLPAGRAAAPEFQKFSDEDQIVTAVTIYLCSVAVIDGDPRLIVKEILRQKENSGDSLSIGAEVLPRPRRGYGGANSPDAAIVYFYPRKRTASPKKEEGVLVRSEDAVYKDWVPRLKMSLSQAKAAIAGKEKS